MSPGRKRSYDSFINTPRPAKLPRAAKHSANIMASKGTSIISTPRLRLSGTSKLRRFWKVLTEVVLKQDEKEGVPAVHKPSSTPVLLKAAYKKQCRAHAAA